MQKATKGVVAAGLGVAMLVGGAGTLAYWTQDETVGGDTISSGHMNLVVDGTNAGCGVWMLNDGEAAPSAYNSATDKLVPGDILTRDCAFTIQAEGTHLRANVGVSVPTFSGADSNFLGKLDAQVTALKVNNAAATDFTEANDGQSLTATVTVTFDPAALDDTEDLNTVLDDLTLTATQVHN